LTRRFDVRIDFDRWNKKKEAVAEVIDRDGNKVIYTTPLIAVKGDEPSYESIENLAVAYLDKNYPDWKNPGAYWDVPAEPTKHSSSDTAASSPVEQNKAEIERLKAKIKGKAEYYRIKLKEPWPSKQGSI